MSFTEAVRSCFQNYASFSGRAPRSEYWYFVLFEIAALVGLAIMDWLIGTAPILYMLGALALVLPALTVGVRRLHDSNKSAWNLLWSLVPFGALYLLWLYIRPGDDGENDYGPPYSPVPSTPAMYQA
jgi:uncharacterized membrane protein YhaH (DUF805 family)